MKLSTRGEYGLRAMFDLALHHGEGPIPLRNVAERQEISENYLEQLISVLRKAGLVRSIRGAQGGYVLNKEPGEIKIGDIIRVLEGPIAPWDCVSGEKDKDACSRAEACVTRGIWEKVRDSIIEVLDSISLQDMCAEKEKTTRENDKHMYYI